MYTMSLFLYHDLVRTAVADQVVAPFACHLCHLVLLCESVEEPEHFSQLVEAARTLAKATDNMTAVAWKQVSETDDDVLRKEMGSLLEPITVSGQHVLLVAQKLSIQPTLTEHKEELVNAAQTLFLGVVKVLLVHDNSTVRKVLSAATRVSEHLSELASCSDLRSLLRVFQVFSDALLLLSHLTGERADSLKDPLQAKDLRDYLETLRRCVPMIHTATCTAIKHPTSKEAEVAKSYILDKVESTVSDIVSTLKNECQGGPPGPCGFYTKKRKDLSQVLESWSNSSTPPGRDLDCLLRDLVFHCMAVASCSREEFQQELVLHCRNLLHLWTDIKLIIKSLQDHEGRLQNICASLQELQQGLNKAMMTAILHQLLDVFLITTSAFQELSRAVRQSLDADASTQIDLDFLQAQVEEFSCYLDRIIQVAIFFSAVANDAKSLENVENSRVSLTRLGAQIASLALDLADNTVETLQKLQEMFPKWKEGVKQLQDALSIVIDIRAFTSFAIKEMMNERDGCDIAYSKRSFELFKDHTTKLMCHMKLVMDFTRRYLDHSEDAIYRNGLLVLLKQARHCQSKMNRLVSDMLLGQKLDVEHYSNFSDNASAAIHLFEVLTERLDGTRHPDLLSPLWEDAHKLDLSEDESCNFEEPGLRNLGSPILDIIESEREESELDKEWMEMELFSEFAHNSDIEDDLEELKVEQTPFEFELLPLLQEVVTVTKAKDVAVLSRACTGVLELSNCYSQAARDALAMMDCKILETFRAELLSLTPQLVQTAQEMAMSSSLGMENVGRLCTRFSDLVKNIRKVLLPKSEPWFHLVHADLRPGQSRKADVKRELTEVINRCADTVQLLTSSRVSPQRENQETLTLLHNKLKKAQNNTRCLMEFMASSDPQVDQVEGLCVLWGLSVQILLNSLDRILGMSEMTSRYTPQMRLSFLSESSPRIQDATKLTSLSCKSQFQSKELTAYEGELKMLTEHYLKAADDLGIMPCVMRLIKTELLHRTLIIKIKELFGLLSKANENYETTLNMLVTLAHFAAEHAGEGESDKARESFENSASLLLENIKDATRNVEDSFDYMQDSCERATLRAINANMSFLMSDIISQLRLMAQTCSINDTFDLEVKIQCWSAKAHYLVEEITKQDGISQEVKENIRTGLQCTPTKGSIPNVITTTIEKRYNDGNKASWQTCEYVAGPKMSAWTQFGSTSRAKYDSQKDSNSGDASSLTSTSLNLKQETAIWDPEDNKIVQETTKMAETLCHMTHYLRKRGPLLNKEAFVIAVKDLMSDCQSVTNFLQVIANRCLDAQCGLELARVVEQILTITNQLSILSSVNSLTPGCKSSDEIVVKNTQNLLHTVLKGVHAAETACVTGLKQPKPNSDEAEVTALCFQWRRKLERQIPKDLQP